MLYWTGCSAKSLRNLNRHNINDRKGIDMNNELKIDPEFKNLIPPLSEEEYNLLETNILSSGKCRNAITVWNNLIIDGHNRFEICGKHGIPFKTYDIHFNSRTDAVIWIIENQLGRRNLTDAKRISLALLKADLLRQKAKENLSLAGKLKSGESDPGIEAVIVRKRIADEAKVSENTVHKFMKIIKSDDAGLKEKVMNGEMKIGTAHRLLTAEMTTVESFSVKEDPSGDDFKYIIRGVLNNLKEIENKYRYIFNDFIDINGEKPGKEFVKKLERHKKAVGELKKFTIPAP